MMSKTNDGGSAFPCTPPQDAGTCPAPGYPFPESGMSLRDYFAAKAMQGLLAQSIGTALGSPAETAAAFAYRVADAMLAAREVKP